MKLVLVGLGVLGVASCPQAAMAGKRAEDARDMKQHASQILLPSVSPDGVQVQPDPLPTGRDQTLFEPPQDRPLQQVAFWFHGAWSSHLDKAGPRPELPPGAVISRHPPADSSVRTSQ